MLLEEWKADRDGWWLAAYEFDYLREPKGSARKAHHLHPLYGRDDVCHAHCEDPHPTHRHYRDVQVTLLEAADEFVRLHTAGDLRCADLFPLSV